MEKRFVSIDRYAIEIEERADKAPKIRGYGAMFYNADDPGTEYVTPWWRERLLPTAFDRAIREQDDVRGLYNHDPSLILGRTTSGTMQLSTDRTGLKYVIDPPDTQLGRDLQTSIRRKDVTGSSFAFTVDPGGDTWRDHPEGTMIREISSVRLFDVSPVSYPAYEATSVSVRSAGSDERAIYDRQSKMRQERVRRRAISEIVKIDLALLGI